MGLGGQISVPLVITAFQCDGGPVPGQEQCTHPVDGEDVVELLGNEQQGLVQVAAPLDSVYQAKQGIEPERQMIE